VIDRIPSSHQIAVHPGSGGAAKCWPAENFAEVIERLWQQNRSVLLLAGPADDHRLESIRRATTRAPSPSPHRSRPYRDAPKSELLQVLANKPLLEVAHHLQACRCYLGNDAGITHLAAMLGVPTVAIFGPSDPEVWRPVGPSVKVIRERTLERLAVDVVMDAINPFI
jgi:heptosyltransferase III